MGGGRDIEALLHQRFREDLPDVEVVIDDENGFATHALPTMAPAYHVYLLRSGACEEAFHGLVARGAGLSTQQPLLAAFTGEPMGGVNQRTPPSR